MQWEGHPQRVDEDEQEEGAGREPSKQPALAGAKDLVVEGQVGARLWRALNVKLRNLSGE